MNHEEQTIEAADGTPLRVERWEPRGPVRMAVVFVHGGAEHVGRYERLARMFGEHGALCLGLDHRGQGASGGRRGHVSAFEDYARDLRLVIETVAQARPANERPDAVPWFVFGHSMGGLISLVYLLDHAKAIPLRGVVLSSPLIEVAVKINPVKRWVGNAATKIWPTLTLPSGIPPEAICRDPDEVARYVRDSRRVTVVTAGWFGAMQRAAARVRAEVATIDTPCLWYVGTGDTICDHRATVELFRSIPDAGERGHALHVFDGYYHELHNEPEPLRAPVLDLVKQWVLERAGLDGDA
ncbi:MAG: lysophospholipase [Myxococcales bacterium]|nr:lysophospholipase [Myxococcales bacterium]